MSRTKDAVIDHLNAENEQDMCECCHEVSEPGERFPQADGAIMCPGCLEDYRKDHLKVKVRFIAQGILTIPPDEIPEGWHEWKDEDKWEWVQEWWGNNITEDMLRDAILMDDVPGDPVPGLLEVNDGEEYHTIAQSREYFAYWNCVSPAELHQEAPYESQQF
jgi:hypothetical protein